MKKEIIDYSIALLVALLVNVVLSAMSQYLLIYKLPEFLIGWLSCTAFGATLKHRTGQ